MTVDMQGGDKGSVETGLQRLQLRDMCVCVCVALFYYMLCVLLCFVGPVLGNR